MKKQILFLLLSMFLFCAASQAQTTAFTYQGRFTDSTLPQPTSGTYNMQFALFNTANAQIGATITNAAVQVTNGIFTVSLDFGANSFDGTARLLEIGVFSTTTNDYVVLNPRQTITPTPYSIRALNATTADNALNVGGTPASSIIIEGDKRLTDTRSPTAGSTNYIQNQNAAAQMSSNFRIDGTGTANIFNATTQFNIGVNRFLSGTGSNTFVGVGSGAGNPTGNNNSFFGREAGFSTATGVSNSFFGTFAGRANLGGNNNSFFGREAGRTNETGVENSFFGVNAGLSNLSGSQNVFLGVQAGSANTTGSNNTLVGTSANVAVGSSLTFATALGSGAVVGTNDTVVLGRGADTVQVPGNLNVAGTFTANINGAGITNLNASNITSGTLSDARLSLNVATLSGTQTFTGVKTFSGGISGNGSQLTNLNATNISSGTLSIARGGTGSTTQNFVDLTTEQTNIAGNKTFSNTLSGNIVNTATQFNFGGQRFLSAPGNENIFIGKFTGQRNSNGNFTGRGNIFIGENAGQDNTGGRENVFVGAQAGFSNFGGNWNAFVGHKAGYGNINGSSNTIFGWEAGLSADSNDNSFFGFQAGIDTINGEDNVFFGFRSGGLNTTGSRNVFIGSIAGYSSKTGSGNVFVGYNAGNRFNEGSNNTIIGSSADMFHQNLSYATAIGAGSIVYTSNTIVIGREDGSDKVIIHGLGSGGSTELCRNSDNFISFCSSSLRYKTNITPFNSGLNLVKRLQPISFDWKSGGLRDLGLGAEDVAAIEPLLATYNKDGQIEGVKYDRIGVVLINAVKEQQAQIEVQQKQIETQNNQLAEQKLLIDGLKKLVCQQNAAAAICQ